jgi:4-hydroxy-tetrahydrodipicolinate reductase
MTDGSQSPGSGLRILVVGYGRMGRIIETLADEYGLEIAGRVTRENCERAEEWPAAEVAIDFSTANAVAVNAPRLAERGLNLVIGTTGWQSAEPRVRDVATRAGIGVVAAPNFALGVNIFRALVERAAELMAERSEFGAWIHELHHAAKHDAPSGTALALRTAMERAGYCSRIDVTSTRAGYIPGTHSVGFDAAAETIVLTHTARDRTAFARGAIEAARWVRGRHGWFTMRDVLRI